MKSTMRRTVRAARLGLPLLATVALAAACGSSSGGATASGAATSSVAAGAAGGASIALTKGHLTDGSGRTVYLWENDTAGKSTCTGACAKVWAPVTASGAPSPAGGLTSAKLTTVTRGDGTTQLAYAGHPLYYYLADKSPGDTNGQGSNDFGAKWWELSASGQAITSAASTPSTQSTGSGGGGGYGY